MKYTDYKKIKEDYDEILEYANSIIESGDLEFEDLLALRRIWERCWYFADFVNINYDFMDLVSEMESEKDRFEVQKIQKCYKDKLSEEIKGLIDCGRSWKFEDYRCIDWTKQLVEFMQRVKETFFK